LSFVKGGTTCSSRLKRPWLPGWSATWPTVAS
jgi:hypothetical protein